MTERLARLKDVKSWLGMLPGNTDSDPMLSRLILAASQFALTYIDRKQFAPADFTENFRGNGKQNWLLRNWPVMSVSSVGISNAAIPAAVINNTGFPTSSGYVLADNRDAPASLDLFGYYYTYRMPCRVVYRAGYDASQTVTIPASPYQLSTTEWGCLGCRPRCSQSRRSYDKSYGDSNGRPIQG
jgi:hypothetical protein